MQRKQERLRLANLELLVAEAGSAAELARRAATNESYLSQIRRQFLTPKGTPRNVGDDLAVKLEKGMEKPGGWMDEYHPPLDDTAHAHRHKIHGDLERGRLSTGIYPRHPLITWPQAGQWAELVDTFDPQDAEQWLPCPIPCSPHTFILRVQGESMEPRFRDGELIFVDPEVRPEHGAFVVVRTEGADEAFLRQLSAEGGRTYLKALNPAWPDPITTLDAATTISAVVVFKGEALR